jgi:hypothetical protein
MTPSARQVFVNAIVYMSRFGGQGPLAPKKSMGRDWALVRLSFASHWKDGVPPDYVRQSFAPGLWKQAESEVPSPPDAKVTPFSPDKLRELIRANLEYLRHDGRAFLIDEDAKALGKSTRSLAILDVISARLGEDGEDAVSRRLLARYLPEHAPDDAATLTAWLAANRDKLFFSDVGGYRWFVDPRPGKPEGTAGQR